VRSRKSATRAYRLDAELIEELKKVAKREGVSENSYVENLLAQRIRASPLIRAFPYIVISRRTLLPILGSANSDGLELAGMDLGKKNFALAKELYESLGRELTFTKFLVEILDKEARWFEVEGAEDRPERLTLRHECGMKWSLFLKSYLTSAYELISREKIKLTPNESYVSVELPTK
jgi:hypothetical protein